MAKISGRLGKFSGSPTGSEEFEQEFYMTNTEAAILLRDLAQEIEAGGRVEANAGTWSLGVNPMQPIKLEVQYKPRKRELEIQVKLKETP
jgi:amphi-Trp domain-containing protein